MSRISLNEKKQRRRFHVFVTIAVLVVAQVTWWTTLFVRNVNEIETLQIENYHLSRELGRPVLSSPDSISKEAYQKRKMFVSESLFFLLLTGIGLYLLFRALKYDQKAHEAQRNFIEILAHESKTPLTALKLRLESILENQTEPTLRDEITAGVDDIRRLNSIVEKTLNLNRMEREELASELVCVADVVKDLVRRLDPFFKSRNTLVTLQLDSQACVRGDLDGLRNSFQSIIENAVIYNDKQEKLLKISVTEASGRVLLCFADNGPGIVSSERELIFEKFYRGKSRSRSPGTGLGLFIARSILQAHQGVIRLLPSPSGALFEITLPVAT